MRACARPSCAATSRPANTCARSSSPACSTSVAGPSAKRSSSSSAKGSSSCAATAARSSPAWRAAIWTRSTACGCALERLAVERASELATEDDFAAIDAILHEFRESRPRVLTEQEAADQDVRFHDAIYRASHHTRLYAAWAALRSQVYVLLLARNVANPDFRELTYKGHLELAYLIRARDHVRAGQAIEAHLRDSYSRVLASYPD